MSTYTSTAGAKEITVFSDLHLGIGDQRDDFHQDKRFVAWLRKKQNAGCLIVGAGDLCDIVQVRNRHESASTAYHRIYRAHTRVGDALAQCLDYYVRGNHEGALQEGFGCEIVDAVQIGGVRIEHGHRFDLFNTGLLKPIGNLATRVAGIAEFVYPDADVWLSRKLGRLMRRGRYGGKEAYRRAGAACLRKSPTLDELVIGHTHKADQYSVPGESKGYWNSGAWTGTLHDSITLPICEECFVEVS